MPYFIIHSSDGDTMISEYSRDGLTAILERMAQEHSASAQPQYVKAISELGGASFGDFNYMPENGYLIIKGEIIIPEVVQTATKISLP